MFHTAGCAQCVTENLLKYAQETGCALILVDTIHRMIIDGPSEFDDFRRSFLTHLLQPLTKS